MRVEELHNQSHLTALLISYSEIRPVASLQGEEEGILEDVNIFRSY